MKLDGVGPVDNRPTTDYLQHFVKKKYHLQLTPDTWHRNSSMGQVEG